MTESRATVKSSTPCRADRTLSAAGVVWICAAQFFVAQVVVQSRWTTPFSLATNFISDLGNTNCGPYPAAGGVYVCSPWHALMNASFVLQGVIVVAGAALAWPSLAGRRWAAAAFMLLIITGIGIAGVGLFPEDVNNAAHVTSAGVQFVTGNVAMIVCGVGLRRPGRGRAFVTISIALGVAGLLATVLFVQGYGLGLGVAGMERVAAYTLPVWLVTAGGLMLSGKHADRKLSSQSPGPTTP
jgi:hypothetical membrane protein